MTLADETPVTACSPTELLPSVTMMQLAMGVFAAQAIGVFARLGVADELAEGPRQVEEIAQQVGAHGSALYRVLRALGDAGLVTKLPDRRFA